MVWNEEIGPGTMLILTGECSHGLVPGDILTVLERVHEGGIPIEGTTVRSVGYDVYRVISKLGVHDLFYRYFHDAEVLLWMSAT